MVGVLAALAAAWVMMRDDGAAPARGELPVELVNRVWVDTLPASARDTIDVLVLVEEPRLGQFMRTSAYQGDFALFGWREAGGRVDIEMLQTGKRHRLRFTVSQTGCEPFDYCLKVKGAPRGARRYVSMKDWVVEAGTDPDRLRAAAFERALAAAEGGATGR